MRRKTAVPAVLAASALLGIGTGAHAAVAAPAAPAVAGPAKAADTCLWFPDGPRVATVTVIKDQAAAHDGPAASCAVGDHLSYGTQVKIECKYVNSSGNRWYYTDRAWIYSPYLSAPSGSVPTCPG
ncbi:hypothetical protein ACH4C2_23350 [Streptomyces sp. NPDC018057]|uniref:hypothetical protein n=1 Tax=unclassified Streptomyces TaxID=2593676 RepID=UPI00379C279C